MGRVSLLGVIGLALVAAGCLGDSSTKTVQIGAAGVLGPTDLVVKVSMTKLGQPSVKQTYRISCADTGTGDGGVTFACSRLTGSNRIADFGVPAGPKSAGPLQDTVTVRGLAGGFRVTRSYYLGSQQFRDWMRILGRHQVGSFW